MQKAAGAADAMKVMGRVAQASNASVEDIAGTAAALRDNLKVDPKDFEAAFSSLITQGKAGSIELRDLSQQLSSVAPLMASFKGGTGLSGLNEMGASLQIIRKGFGSSAEAATGFQALVTSLLKHSDKFQHAGVKLFDVKDGKKSLKGFHEIMLAIGNSKLVNDPAKMRAAFGSVEALRAFMQLQQNVGVYDQLIEKSHEAGVVQHDLQRYMESDAGRVAKAWNSAKNTLADAFTPERIKLFSDALVEAGKAMAALVGGMAKAVDIVQTVAHGAASLFGGHAETTMDEQAMDARAKYDAERTANLKKSGFKGDIAKRKFQEDMLAERMMENGPGYWEGQAQEVGMNLQQYLSTQRKGIQNSGASNMDQLLNLNAQQLGKAFAYELTKNMPKVEVKIDKDVVAKAEQSAPKHRRRPGG